MHELSLAGGVLRLVEESAQREGFVRVAELRLEAGALSGVDVHALRFALEAMMPGTILEGASLVIHEPPGTAFCSGCGHTVEIGTRADDCPRCGAARLTPNGGMELKVAGLLVHDP